jgi:hypothetical protein
MVLSCTQCVAASCALGNLNEDELAHKT